jgi:hypothetical protein
MKTQNQTHWASFNRFEFEMPAEAVESCHHQGACDSDVEYWAPRIHRPEKITPELLAAELRECGAWDAEELADDAANWRRIIWLAAGNIQEESKGAA